MKTITTNEAGWRGQIARVTDEIKDTVRIWRRERAMMRQQRLTETLQDRSLRRKLQMAADYVPLLEESANASAAAAELRSQPRTPINKRRSKFYRWQPNAIRPTATLSAILA